MLPLDTKVGGKQTVVCCRKIQKPIQQFGISTIILSLETNNWQTILTTYFELGAILIYLNMICNGFTLVSFILPLYTQSIVFIEPAENK